MVVAVDYHGWIHCWRLSGKTPWCWCWQIVADSVDEKQSEIVEGTRKNEGIADSDLVGEVYALWVSDLFEIV